MFNFKKKDNQDYFGYQDYEEINEKKTTTAGYVLLLIMFGFLVGISQTIFSDLRKIPDRPVAPSYCVKEIALENLKTMRLLSRCDFNDIDKLFDLNTKYLGIKDKLSSIADKNQQIDNIRDNINNRERTISQLKKQYGLSLQEKMAEERNLFDVGSIQVQVTQLRSQNIEDEKKIQAMEIDREVEVSSISDEIESLNSSYKKALDYYKNKNAWYQFKIFLLMLLFVLPFFAASVRYYLKLKKKNSPYTIIATAVMSASAILFLQTVLTFLYEILPKEWLERIFKFFMSLPAMRYILYYGSVLLSITVFGGIVYYIQKNVFDPRKVAIRRLKENKCPGCSFTINQQEDFCPNCGTALKEKCANCNGKRVSNLPYCPDCGGSNKARVSELV